MEWVSDIIGVPFLDRGRTPDGWDCWGLVRWCINKERDILLPSYDNLYDSASADCLNISSAIKEHSTQWEKVEKGRERIGDAILIRMKNLPIHVGYILAPGTFLHVDKVHGTVKEKYTAPKWEKRVLGFYRYA